MQLLEEFGIVGFSLFLLAAVLWIGSLLRARAAGFSRRRTFVEPIDRVFPLCALLCTWSLVVHSLGDFSLQIPAVTWTFSTLLAFGYLSTLSQRGDD